MDRRNWLKIGSVGAVGIATSSFSKENWLADLEEEFSKEEFKLADFGDQFLWGAACAAFQVEGAWNLDGKGESIWDHFTHKKGNVNNNETADIAVDFYHKFKEDIALVKALNLKVFRFSIAWTRIFPNGIGEINQKGVDFYHQVIDECIKQGVQPWVTLYHWDLPQKLQDKGGWTNREVLKWFDEYVTFCAKEFGSKVKNWMVMNEPAAFVGLGYMLGYHAPGKKGISNFLKATHHVCLSMALGGKILRKEVLEANIGTTFSCSYVEPINSKSKNIEASKRIDALINRLYIEPILGKGYPYDVFPALKRIEKYFEPGDEQLLAFDFDFIGLQNYFRVVGKHSLFPPVMFAKEVPATKRAVPINEMNFEVYPEGIYKILKQFSEYKEIKKIIVTENGVCYKDFVVDGKVADKERIQFFKDYLYNVLKAKNEGVPVDGYFIWSLTDNFEWSEGYHPRFGIVHIDFETQKRTIKDSGYWFKEQLKS
jgi:beta-glucosidase